MEWTDEELAVPLSDEAKETSRQGNIELAAFVVVGVVLVFLMMGHVI